MNTTTDTNAHPVATKIGTIIGRYTVPTALVLGIVYVVKKTTNV